jgi:translation initiation factor IF-1
VAGEDAIEIEGIVTERMADGLFRLELPNGHNILAHTPLRLREQVSGFGAGDRLTVEMTPFDMSKGRVKSGRRILI